MDQKQPIDGAKSGNVVSDNDAAFEHIIGAQRRFASLGRLVTRDLNNYINAPTFSLYKRDDITKYLTNPSKYEKQLRKAMVYIYGASSHFRRLIQYFVALTDLSYVVEPFNINPQKANVRIMDNNYRKVLRFLSSANLQTQAPKIITTCMREDVFYGTVWLLGDTLTIQQLPSDYCAIQSVEDNVPNVTFDFSYFNSKQALLKTFPPEFETKYNQYQKDRMNRWIELDSPWSFAIKCNSDILDYALPPFAGILREVYDIEDYKQLKKSKTAIENYAMLAMRLPTKPDGDWLIDYKKATTFWENLDYVLPDEIGSILTPMEIDKIDFERSHNGDTNTVADAEQNLYSASGVSSLLFNNEKASANALLLSIKADQAITYGIVKSIGDALNRILHSINYGKNFIINFLDVSPYNRKEVGDAYLKAASYGLPTISAYAASQGIGQAELDAMSFLESKVIKYKELFQPIVSSSQLTSDQLEEESTPGAPKKEMDELTDSGEQSAEDKDDWG